MKQKKHKTEQDTAPEWDILLPEWEILPVDWELPEWGDTNPIAENLNAEQTKTGKK